MRMPIWLYRALIAAGVGHVCKYDDPTHPDYIGFTCGVCYQRGFHRGRRSRWFDRE